MTVAFDTQADLGSFTTTSPDNTTYTPVGTPKGILVGIAHNFTTLLAPDDLITGVTYGGVAMTRVATAVIGSSPVGEPGRSYLYFLGASIPTGAQTIAISHTATSTVKWAGAWSVTAATDTEIGAFATRATTATDPQLAIDTGANASFRFLILFSGVGSGTDLTVISGTLAVASSPRFDFTDQFAIAGRQTAAAGSGSVTIGYTAVSEETAMIAAGVQEVSGAATVDPYPYIGGGYYPVEG